MIFISLSMTNCAPYARFSYFMRKQQMPSDKIFKFCNVTLFQQSSIKGTTDVQTRINMSLKNPKILVE